MLLPMSLRQREGWVPPEEGSRCVHRCRNYIWLLVAGIVCFDRGGPGPQEGVAMKGGNEGWQGRVSMKGGNALDYLLTSFFCTE
jgi:N-acyl-D-aspartate/D-glutamate deacylase